MLAGLQAEEVQLETSIVALKRQQAALSAIGAAMMHECAPEFLPELSKAQEGLTAAHRSLSACLQSSADQDAGDQSLQHSRAGSREASSDTLVTATDQALVSRIRAECQHTISVVKHIADTYTARTIE